MGQLAISLNSKASRSDINVVQTKFNGLRKAVIRINDIVKVKANLTAIGNLKRDMTTFTTALNSRSTKLELSTIRYEFGNLRRLMNTKAAISDINDVRTDISHLTDSMNSKATHSDIATFNNQIKMLETLMRAKASKLEISILTNSVKNMTSSLSSLNFTLQAKVQIHKKVTDSLLQAFTKQVADLKSRIPLTNDDNNNSPIIARATVQGSVNPSTASVDSTLVNDIEQLKLTVHQLGLQLSATQQSASDVTQTAAISSLNTQISTLQSTIQRLQLSIETSKYEQLKNSQEITVLHGMCSGLNASVYQIRVHLSSVDVRITTLTNKVDILNVRPIPNVPVNPMTVVPVVTPSPTVGGTVIQATPQIVQTTIQTTIPNPTTQPIGTIQPPQSHGNIPHQNIQIVTNPVPIPSQVLPVVQSHGSISNQNSAVGINTINVNAVGVTPGSSGSSDETEIEHPAVNPNPILVPVGATANKLRNAGGASSHISAVNAHNAQTASTQTNQANTSTQTNQANSSTQTNQANPTQTNQGLASGPMGNAVNWDNLGAWLDNFNNRMRNNGNLQNVLRNVPTITKVIPPINNTPVPNLVQNGGQTTDTTQRCPNLSIPPRNGYYHNNGVQPTKGVTAVGQTISFSCNTGYSLVGNEELVCGQDRKWRGNDPGLVPVCQVKSCPPLESRSNVYMSPRNQFTYGTKVLFSCSGSNVLMGNPMSNCMSNQKWSFDSQPSCVPRSSISTASSCSHSPQVPEYGTIYPQNNNQHVGSVVRFACNAGYELWGPTEIICLINGEWSGQEPKCEQAPVCELLDPDEHGTLTPMDQNNPSSTARYTCDAGFKLLGSQEITCLPNGEWTSEEPNCELGTQCVTLQPPENVSMYPIENPIQGSVVTFNCPPGYVLSGYHQLRCLESGLWDGPTPSCIPGNYFSFTAPGCPPLRAGLHTSVRFSTAGYKAHFVCDEGYHLTGKEQMVCSNNAWSGHVPSCVHSVPCKRLTGPEFGTVYPEATDESMVPGSTTYFSCKAGYSIKGQHTSTCTASGLWSNPAPTCVKDAQCTPIQPPANGSMFPVGKSGIGTAVTVACNAGFRLIGEQTVTCLKDAHWSNRPARCLSMG